MTRKISEQDLLNLKTQIDQAKIRASELRGRRDYLMQQLTDVWHCKSIEEAQTRLKKLDVDIKALDKQIGSGIAKLELKIREAQ